MLSTKSEITEKKKITGLEPSEYIAASITVSERLYVCYHSFHLAFHVPLSEKWLETKRNAALLGL